ncbi:MAG: magnesium transporter CorA family protein [Chloroflexota bacterium]|nr:MAG: magnesium transporter CorA family protein [Chloroflexota bacterium]
MSVPFVDEEKQSNMNLITCGKLTWIYIEAPTTQNVEYLARNFSFHPLNLDDVLSRVQRPKIDEYPDHLFIVLHFPVYDKENRVTHPSEVDIFISESYVITINKSGDLKPLAKFFKECRLDDNTRNNYMCRSSGFLLYHILDALVNYCFPILDKVVDNAEKLEDLIFARPVPETVHEIMMIRRDLISFRRVIHPQIGVVEALEREEYPFFKEDQDIYFGDIADHIRKIWDGLEDCKEVVDGLADTSNWLTSHRIQEIMRVLTIVMAIMAPATLLASIYGMNVYLPGGREASFITLGIILSIMFGIAAAMLWFFRRRHWI